jgi:hypothetical protein
MDLDLQLNAKRGLAVPVPVTAGTDLGSPQGNANDAEFKPIFLCERPSNQTLIISGSAVAAAGGHLAY